jgi:hypothetical protein
MRKRASFSDVDSDPLLRIGRAVGILDTLDSMNRRKQDAQNELDEKLSKTNAAGTLGDFAATFDPLNVEHRQELDRYRHWAAGEGMTAQEIDMGFEHIDRRMAALDVQLATMREASGISDWEKTPDGKRIDIHATFQKSNAMKQDLEKSSSSWSENDRLLHQRISADPNWKMSSAERVAFVNANKSTLKDYQEVTVNGLWQPPQGFNESFIGSIKGGSEGVAPGQEGLTVSVYNRTALETNPGYLRALGYSRRIAAGEQPIFDTDEKGDYKYDSNGVARVKQWVNTKQVETQKSLAGLQEAQADAAIKSAEASMGVGTQAAKVLSVLQNQLNQPMAPAERESIEAAMSILSGQISSSIQGMGSSGAAPAARPSPRPTPAPLNTSSKQPALYFPSATPSPTPTTK